MKKKIKKIKLSQERVLVKFNTGSRAHKSKKDAENKHFDKELKNIRKNME